MRERAWSPREVEDVYKSKRKQAIDHLAELTEHLRGLPITTDNYRLVSAVHHYAGLLKELADYAKERGEYAAEAVNTGNS